MRFRVLFNTDTRRRRLSPLPSLEMSERRALSDALATVAAPVVRPAIMLCIRPPTVRGRHGEEQSVRF